MNISADALERIADALGDLDGATAAVAGCSDADLHALVEAIGRVRRRVDALSAPVAAEVQRRSRRELGRDSFARRRGCRSAQALLTERWAIDPRDAARIIRVGDATASRLSLTGDPLPAKRPLVASAVSEGILPLWAASAICENLDQLSLRATASQVNDAESLLVDRAPGLSPQLLTRLFSRLRAHLDPDGQEPRDDAARAARTLTIRETDDGLICLRATLDAASAAPVITALDALVTGMLRRTTPIDGRNADGTPGGPGAGPLDDTRSLGQMRADALVTLCRHALGCRSIPDTAGTTVIVRMTLDDLTNGTGTATIDGLHTPVSAGTARRLAADARVIPWVMGADSSILDFGRSRRLFTRTQRHALAERDGGCALCGAPPPWCDAHHLRWWTDHGPTDLNNGVLLCTGCHHRVHDDGWDIRITGTGTSAAVHFIPPAHLDPTRTPIAGGRHRYDIAA